MILRILFTLYLVLIFAIAGQFDYDDAVQGSTESYSTTTR